MPALDESKLPMDSRPLIRDPDLAAGIERLLVPYSGKKLEAAQAAIRRVRNSPIEGQFGVILKAYETAIADAVSKVKPDKGD
jgi:hypothetical protein